MLRQFKILIDDILNGSGGLGGSGARMLDAKEVPIACAALLVHCAKADGVQSVEEDAKLRELLSAHFAMDDTDSFFFFFLSFLSFYFFADVF